MFDQKAETTRAIEIIARLDFEHLLLVNAGISQRILDIATYAKLKKEQDNAGSH